ncbi:LETM1 domain-containing protein 1, partial [Cyanistes caeruleus]|uniref:LETM1 domain-containing protein 1 n=1 Tax=Cyanistes caeruleus TaxID=156563 RepID=UPI000CDB7D43
LLPLPRYFFPRQLLIRYFWTPKQQLEFLDAYDCIRRDSYRDVLRSLALAARSLPEPQPRQLLQQLCAQVEGGARPQLAQLLAVRSLFSGSVLALNRLQVDHVRALSQVLFLTPHLPAFFLRHRLRSHVLEIRHLDRALLQLGLGQLSEEELRAACYLRGLNSTHLGQAECRAWLEQWLRLSCELQGTSERGATAKILLQAQGVSLLGGSGLLGGILSPSGFTQGSVQSLCPGVPVLQISGGRLQLQGEENRRGMEMWDQEPCAPPMPIPVFPTCHVPIPVLPSPPRNPPVPTP